MCVFIRFRKENMCRYISICVYVLGMSACACTYYAEIKELGKQ